MQIMTKVKAIREYFGLRPGTTSADFMREYKDLSPEERLELAQGAARELGLTAAAVDFPLG